MMITIIDYNSGNLTSVELALKKKGYDVEITGDPDRVEQAERIIFPGVGSAGQAMAELRSRDLIDPIKSAIKRGIPFLGICLGMQILFDYSYENGGVDCLGILSGRVRRFDFTNSNLKVPHMGWNQVKQADSGQDLNSIRDKIWKGIQDQSWFYFVHSYYVDHCYPQIVAGRTCYAFDFVSAIAYQNLVATQFHPEKSGSIGLLLLDNFCKGDLSC